MCVRNGLVALILFLFVTHATGQTVDDVAGSINDTISDVTEMVLPGVSNIRLGLGPEISPDYEGSNGYGTSIKPLISLRYRDLIQIDNNNIQVNLFGGDRLFPSDRFRAGPILKLDFGRDESDSEDLAGLGNVGTSIELGLFASYTVDRLRARIRVQQDMASGHNGAKLILDLRKIIRQSDKLIITGSINATWADNDYMDAYFSITEVQSQNSGLPVFDAGWGLSDIRFALTGNYTISARWAVITTAGYTRLFGDAADSPVVELRGAADQFVAGVFAVYSF
jgi:outer membrane scaffolding protein for murein synthesis (MipA/OmpV family)